MYQEWPSAVDHATVWTARGEGRSEQHLVLPDGCLDLLWFDDELVVAGPDTAAYQATWTPAPYVGLRFAAGVGPCVIGVPAHEIRDQRVPLAQLWPSAEVRRLTERLAAAHPAARAQSRMLEQIAVTRLRDASPPDRAVEYTARMLAHGMRVEHVADAVGLSPRQLHRRSVVAFGYGPKTLARILRLNRALDLGRLGRPAADVAVAAGYADQAHLAREVKSLTRATFTSLVGPPVPQPSADGRAA